MKLIGPSIARMATIISSIIIGVSSSSEKSKLLNHLPSVDIYHKSNE
jgi:hypothetical protein